MKKPGLNVTKNQSKTLATLTSHVGVRVDVLGYPNIWRLHAIREYTTAGYSKRNIAKILHCGRITVTKYLNGDFEELCCKDFRSGMEPFYDYIIKELSAESSRKDVYRSLLTKGYLGGQTAAYDYMNKLIERFQIDIAVYISNG